MNETGVERLFPSFWKLTRYRPSFREVTHRKLWSRSDIYPEIDKTLNSDPELDPLIKFEKQVSHSLVTRTEYLFLSFFFFFVHE